MNVISLSNILEGCGRQMKRPRTRLKGEMDAVCGMFTGELELVSLPQIATALQTLRQISEQIEIPDLGSRQALAGIEGAVAEI